MRLLLVVLGLCAIGASPAAVETSFSFPRATPEAHGISSSAILAFIEEAERKIDALHSVMIVRHGHVVAEGWWAPYAATEPHMMFSLSKSFTSTAVGLAVAEGKLRIDDPVLDFFPDLAPPSPGANLKALRVVDLLTMTAGHHAEDIQNFPYTSDDNVVGKFLALPVAHKPGTLFVYNTPASYMLSAIVQKVTGQTVLDYLRPRLFAPLGIDNPEWEASKQGISMGGFGLSVRTEDIARFGQLYLRRGNWQGRQLLPAEWVDAATSRQVSNGSSPSNDWEQGYGYQFWRSRHGFRGDGAHGQFCLVLPQHDTVIAITAGTRDMGSVMNLVWERLLPALEDKALPDDSQAHRKLTAKLATLTLPAIDSTAGAGKLGTPYVFPANETSVESLMIEPAGNGHTIALTVSGVEQRITAVPGGWRKGTWHSTPAGYRGTLVEVNEEQSQPLAATGGWTAADTYTLKVCRYRTPFVVTYRMRFHADAVAVEIERNVGPADRRLTKIAGSARAPSAARHQN